MKGECDVPSIKPIFEPSNEINLYSYVHQAILMPEDGNSHIVILFKILFEIRISLCFIDFMFDKEDNIEILSAKPQDNDSSRPESRNLEDRCAINLDLSIRYNTFFIFLNLIKY